MNCDFCGSEVEKLHNIQKRSEGGPSGEICTFCYTTACGNAFIYPGGSQYRDCLPVLRTIARSHNLLMAGIRKQESAPSGVDKQKE
jgi:hypothetical protein